MMDSSMRSNAARSISKPSIGSKSNSFGTTGKPVIDSPYYSGSKTERGNYGSTRRTQSATQSRERDMTVKQQAKANQRKYSDPTLSMMPSIETKVLHKSLTKPKSASAVSARQRKDMGSREIGSGDVRTRSAPSTDKKKYKKTPRHCLGDDINSAFDMLSHEMSFSEHTEELSLEPNYYDDNVLLNHSDTLYRDVVALCNEMGLDPSAIKESKLRNIQNHSSPRNLNLSYEYGEEISSVTPPPWSNISATSTPRAQQSSHRPQSQSHPNSPIYTQIAKNLQQLKYENQHVERLDQQQQQLQQSRPISADSAVSDQSCPNVRDCGGSNSKCSKRSSRPSSGAGGDDAYAKILSSLRHIEDEERKGSETAAKFGDFLRKTYGSPTPTNYDNCSPRNSARLPSRPQSTTLERSQSQYGERQEYQESPREQGNSSYLRGRESSCSAQIRTRTPTMDRSHYTNSKGIRSPPDLSDWSTGSIYVVPSPKKEASSVPKLPPIDGPEGRPRLISPGGSGSRPISRVSQFEETEFGYGRQQQHQQRSGSSSTTQREDQQYSGRQENGREHVGWETSDEKAKNLYSFLDEVEKSDRDILFSLKYDGNSPTNMRASGRPTSHAYKKGTMMDNNNTLGKPSHDFSAQTMDSLIRRGSVELAREVIMLERNLEDSGHNINVLEETLLSQRELNIRNIKCAERDLKKRLKLQQEEFELALSRHQAFVDQLIGEKRALQDKCEKVLKESKDSEQKYQNQIKSLQEKHMDELKRLRKIQENAEKNRKTKWVGVKTQEIREMTVKGLEPEVQRIITRHQQEMSEMRAWHADELREMEERYARKQTIQLQELREGFGREKEEACRRERDLNQKRFDAELQRLVQDFETQKRRIFNEMQDEKNRFAAEETKFRELMQENVRKAQIKGEVEVDNVREECELKIVNLERRHENEVRSLKDVYEGERESWINNFTKKQEQLLHEREAALIETLSLEKDKEFRDREKRLKEDFDKLRREDEADHEARIKRMSDKFQSELADLEISEKELKQKFSQAKAEVLGKEEEIFSLKTTLGLKEKQNIDLSDSNMKMLEERAHLTSVIRREFAAQIEILEEECRGVKAAVSELRGKHKLELETREAELEKVCGEKDTEIEKIGLRVKQALGRKEDTIQELSKQLEKSQIRIRHLDDLLEQQRKDFVSSMTTPTTVPSSKKK